MAQVWIPPVENPSRRQEIEDEGFIPVPGAINGSFAVETGQVSVSVVGSSPRFDPLCSHH